MCWHFSLRGVAFFGASIHLCSGLIQMGSFLDTIMFLASNPKNNQTMESFLVTLANLMYAGLRLPLSSLIFIGVEKESIGLLTWPPIAYFLLQVSGFMMKIKYGTMKMTMSSLPTGVAAAGAGIDGLGNGRIQWEKEEFLLPTNLEELIEVTLFSFIFTSCHLLVLFFFVQKIETSVQGQVLDPSPGYSVTFFPHPIQPPSTPSSRLRLVGMGIGDPHRNQVGDHPPTHSESFRNLSYTFPALNANLSNSTTTISGSSNVADNPHPNQAPPPYQYEYDYHDGNFNVISQTSLDNQQQQHHQLQQLPSTSSPTIFPSSIVIHHSTRQFADSPSHSLLEHPVQENDQDLRMPLLPLCHSSSSSVSSMGNATNNHNPEHRITIISPIMQTPTLNCATSTQQY